MEILMINIARQSVNQKFSQLQVTVENILQNDKLAALFNARTR